MVAKPTFTSPPSEGPPNRNEPATFSTRSDAHVAWQVVVFPQLAQGVDFVDQESTLAQAAAEAAAVSAATANASEWVSAASYTAGDVVWSLVDYAPYRAKSNHSGQTTDPSADPTRWAAVSIANLVTGTDDVTAGRILTVGHLGHGGQGLDWESASFDLNDPIAGSIVRFSGSTLNGPGGIGLCFTMQRNTTDHGQLAILRNGTAFIRGENGGSWSSWNLLYGRLGILGTVSESSGTPTGAIIERSSNGNGEYVRFADGTQICTHVVSGDAIFTWTYPAAFAAVDAVQLALQPSGVNYGVGMDGEPTTTNVLVEVFNTGANTNPSDASMTSRSVHLTAIGRWFT